MIFRPAGFHFFFGVYVRVFYSEVDNMKITDDERGNAHRIVGVQQDNGMIKTLSLLQKSSPSRKSSVALSNNGKVGPQPEDSIRSSKVVGKIPKLIAYYMRRLFDLILSAFGTGIETCL